MRVPKIKLVFDRKKLATTSKEGVVDIRVCFMSKQKFLSTGVKVLKGQWDERNECVKKRSDAVALNKALGQIKSEVTSFLSEMSMKGDVDLGRLNELFRPKVYEMTFLEYIKERSDKRNVSDHTKERYATFLTVFQQWGGVVNFADINEASVRAFDEWLHKREVYGHLMEQSTIASYHKYFKIFINDAVVDGYVQENPYQSKRIHIDKGEGGQIPCLTAEQVERVECLDLEGYLDKTRDLFLFQCYTGLAFSDLLKFKLKDHQQDEEGNWIIRGLRTKTGTEYVFPLSDKALAIVEKYNGRIPPISNQKYNGYLKIIGQMIGVPTLHSHMGRSTFASICLNEGLNTDVLKHCLGHQTTIQTNRYATMREKTIVDAFKTIKKGGC